VLLIISWRPQKPDVIQENTPLSNLWLSKLFLCSVMSSVAIHFLLFFIRIPADIPNQREIVLNHYPSL